MKLLRTECHWDGWDRIVDIYTERYDSLPEYINDGTTYKVIILEKGVLSIQYCGEEREVKAPAILMLSQKDKLDYKIKKDITTDVIFFNPCMIRDEFTFDRIDSSEFDDTLGQVIYQDYMLIRSFVHQTGKFVIIPLPTTGFKHIKGLYSSLDTQLIVQKDGFWPCRSRSFLMEILHFIVYSFFIDPESEEEDESFNQTKFAEIAEYLEQHLAESITLAKLTKTFAINRNKLNEIFMDQASVTCLTYLLNLRMDLAKILLSKTELPINEISARVGYPDPNYFTKVFKDNAGVTPTKFRYP